MNSDFEIYEGKSFKDLCNDIYNNQSTRKKQIEIFIGDLRPMIKTVTDAMIVVPLIKEYIDAGISNDEHLVKLAQICQKIMTANSKNEGGEESFLITEEEKKQLWAGINEISKPDPILVINTISSDIIKEKE